MRRIDRPSFPVTSDPKSALFLTLNKPVVADLADALGVLQMEEQFLVATVRGAVVDRGGTRVVWGCPLPACSRSGGR